MDQKESDRSRTRPRRNRGPLAAAVVATAVVTVVTGLTTTASVSAQASSADLVRTGQGWPALDVNDRGGALAVTLRKAQASTYGTVYATHRSSGRNWGSSKRLSIADAGNSWPAVGMGSRGYGVVVWLHAGAEGRKAVISRTRNPDGSWGPVQRVSEYRTGMYGLRVEVSAGNGTVARWSRFADGLTTHYVAYRAPGGSWSLRAVDPAATAEQVDIAIDGGNTAYVSYTNETGSQVMLMTRTPGSGWSAPEVLFTGERMSFDFAVTEAGLRTLAVSEWLEEPAPNGSYLLRLLRQQEAGGALVEDWVRPNASSPRLAVAGGHVRVLWREDLGDPYFALYTRSFHETWSAARMVSRRLSINVYEFVRYEVEVRSDGRGLLSYLYGDDRAATIGPKLMREFGPGGSVLAEQVLDSNVYLGGDATIPVAIGEQGLGLIGWVERPNSDQVRVRSFTL